MDAENFMNTTSNPYSQGLPPQTLSGASSSDEDTSLREQIGLILFFAATILSIFLVTFCSIRQFYYHTFGNEDDSCWSKICCAMRHESGEGQESDQYFADRILAEALQRRLNEEERERERLAKRKERRMWYEYYMKPCTVIVEDSDLFYAQTNVPLVEDGQASGHGEDHCKDEDSSLDSDSEEIGENSKKDEASQFLLCSEDDENASLHLQLRSLNRCVDGTCALCIDEYEVGDEVVWSNLLCSHAFHKECLMQWLSKGKKRCPICRHWFVPGTKIEDQKLAHGASWERALSEMNRREKEEKMELAEFEKDTMAPQDIEQDFVDTLNDSSPSSQTVTPTICSGSDDIKLQDIEFGSRDINQGSVDLDHINNSSEMSEMLDIENQQPSEKGEIDPF